MSYPALWLDLTIRQRATAITALWFGIILVAVLIGRWRNR